MLPRSQFLTILTSESLSRAGVVQILATGTSKSAPALSVLNDFDFQIAVVRRRARCKFWRLQLPKVLRARQFLLILTFKSLRAQVWCKFWRLQLPKVLRARQFLLILTFKSLARAGVVQILATSTSKSAPSPSVFNDFDFQIVLARRRGANFGTSSNLQQPILRARPFLGADGPSQRSQKTLQKHSISRASYLLCCITSARSRLLVDTSSAATLSI